ncbi:MAG: aminotransferase class III-fold pyridoxal phosphate-dependent enzyme [Actinomycetia bacterium]|nr:aminotransferase class III-fold pyridoxal phosphate-dependent enzyme [Actinomycetes bacterium]
MLDRGQVGGRFDRRNPVEHPDPIDHVDVVVDTERFDDQVVPARRHHHVDGLIQYYWGVKGETGRRRIISRVDAWHGTTVAAMSIGGKPGDKMPEFTFITDTIHHVSSPNFYRRGAGCTEQEFADDPVQEFQDKVAELGGPDHVAGFFAEPIMGAGGVIMPPADHLQRIAAYCHEHGILYVSDEVGPCFLERLETLTDLPMVAMCEVRI